VDARFSVTPGCTFDALRALIHECGPATASITHEDFELIGGCCCAEERLAIAQLRALIRQFAESPLPSYADWFKQGGFEATVLASTGVTFGLLGGALFLLYWAQ
jgi:hypothetical protein